ncbi:hypothetical protein [Pseudovibrio sp. WM33]|uniref:hypothetical protein n=1 Tax=Pseudovibrio sp. WM33 TaxID=1735585 RepID=UPI0007AE5366|nr:hypothetical protein [Pseudovibrio sp. WM33]KZL24621.1 hypothetical protein PsWM33_02501 [Pseudovibrio sp. WM33]
MNKIEKAGTGKKLSKAGLQALAGAVPFAGGALSAVVSAWSDHEQEQVNLLLQQWIEMLREELKEKEKTIIEIMARLDLNDQKVKDRVESDKYQAILKKAFRNWSRIDSEDKRQKVRNILSHSASTKLASDDVVKLFIDWFESYSDFHFEVIGEIYRKGPIGRGSIWSNLGRSPVREDSAEADLYKLLIRDLSTGGVIRQHRETDYYGNFIKPKPTRGTGNRSNTMKSSFDNTEDYVLTELGKQFVHYAMTEITARVEFDDSAVGSD